MKTKEQLELLYKAIENSFEGIVLTDPNGKVMYANKAVEKISGVPIEDFMGKTIKEMEEDGIVVRQSVKVLKKDPLTISQQVCTGKEVFITSKPVYDDDGNVICFIANYRELSSLNELYKEHEKQVQVDYNELQQLREQILQTGDWIGNSYKTKMLKEKVAKVAKTEAIILIVGESGVGKEVIAKTIHKLSNRKNEPFIQINCGAIPESLMEAELFGYEKGAFTGASVSKPGLFEIANRGTVLLDEIGEMPLHLQVKLLRVIQTKEIMRVGGTKPKKLDVRFIAATNRDLKQMVKEGTFRKDLYYRLNVIPIKAPPLRERKEDIPALAQYFLNEFNKKYHLHKSFSSETIQMLMAYSWPGNVRQLRNTIEQLVLLTESDVIEWKNLPKEILQENENSSLTNTSETNHDEIIPLKELREKTEWNMIQLALSKYKSIREAAKHLQVHHTTLVKKIQKYTETN